MAKNKIKKTDLVDKMAISQVIGCLIQKPELLSEKDEYNIEKEDFPERFHQIIFGVINNLYVNGVSSIDFITVDSFLKNYDAQYKIFTDNQGIDYLESTAELAELDNFYYYYTRMKKFSILRTAVDLEVGITSIYDPNVVDLTEKAEMLEEFDNMDINTMIDLLEVGTITLREKYCTSIDSYGQDASKGMTELKETLKKAPALGLPLESEILNTITRGAVLKKLFLRSGSTGTGKTRLSINDACYIGATHRYEFNRDGTGEYVEKPFSEPVVFITTELEVDEIQTMMMANISGVNEEKILDGKYEGDEEERVDQAIEILDNSPIYIELLSNWDLDQLMNKIKEYKIKNKVRYVFFDYLHTSVKIMSNLQKEAGMKLREDQVLLLSADKLKNYCNRHGLFLSTSTQLNGDWKTAKDADETLLRGSKAIADKVDIGIIAMKATAQDLKALEGVIKKKGLNHEKNTPNLVYHIFKIRRGKLTKVKLWLHSDLGTCRTTDLFLTDNDYKVIKVTGTKIDKIIDDNSIDINEVADIEETPKKKYTKK